MCQKRRQVVSGLGPLERKVMALLWRHGGATVRRVAEQLADADRPAYTTVMTVMARLAKKGLLARRLVGRAYVYSPIRTKSEYLAEVSKTRVRALVQDFGEVALAHFVQEIEKADPRRLARLNSTQGAAHE